MKLLEKFSHWARSAKKRGLSVSAPFRVAVLLVVLSLIFSTQAIGEVRYKIAVLTHQYGGYARLSEAVQAAAKMAVSEEESKISLFFYKAPSSKDEAVEFVEKASEDQGINIIIALDTRTARTIAPEIALQEIPFFAYTGDTSIAKGRAFTVRTAPSAHEIGNAFVDEIRRRGYKALALITASTPDFILTRDIIKTGIEEKRIVSDEICHERAVDFRPYLIRARKAKADAVGLLLHPGQPRAFFQQAKKQQLQAVFFGGSSFFDRTIYPQETTSAFPTWFVDAKVEPSFFSRFRKAAPGRSQYYSAAATHYDLLKILLSLANENTPPKEVVSALLKTQRFSGAAGEFQISRKGSERFLTQEISIWQPTRESFKALR